MLFQSAPVVLMYLIQIHLLAHGIDLQIPQKADGIFYEMSLLKFW